MRIMHYKGLFQRDIKPSNILLGKDGHIQLIVFGTAREEKESANSDRRPSGTRAYPLRSNMDFRKRMYEQMV
ncbi:MAG: hypothetical protein PHG19_07265 [Anaerotignum sp.]|nr:hypothetical protein [Anaerotignum sp.]